MDGPAAGHPLATAIALAGRGPALIALLFLIVVEAGYAMGLSMMIAAMGPGEYARIGSVVTIAGFAIFLVVATVQYHLARRLGGDDGQQVPPNIGLWIGLTLAYGIASIVWSGVTTFAIIRFSTDPTIYPLASGGLRVIFQIAMFAVLVRTVAAAHSGNRVRFGQIWSLLWTTRIGWLATYAGIAAGIWAAGWIGSMATRPFFEQSSPLLSLPGAVIGAIGQVALILYAIAVYRTCGDDGREAATFV